MCILSADKGTVQKVIVLPRDDLLTEELVLEEVEVFKVSFCQALYTLTCLLFASFLAVSFSFVAMTFNSQLHYLFPVKVPTPITTMKISSKRVSLSLQLIFLTFAHITREETVFQKEKATRVARSEKVTS